MKNLKYLIIMPTFDEADNIQIIIPEIFNNVDDNVYLLVVDDDSPDKTSDVVANLQELYPRLHLISKTEDKGFAKAYISGFNYAIENNYDYVIQMDADGSHQPKFINDLIKASKQYDYVIGSRWIKGGSVVNWPLKRKILSIVGNFYAQVMLRSRLKDITGGFKAINVELLKNMDIDSIESKGYSFQIELMLRACKSGSTIYEVPIEFVEREYGVSKMSSSIIVEAMSYVTTTGIKILFGK